MSDAPSEAPTRPGRRLDRGASLYLALVWAVAPIILIFWVLPPAGVAAIACLGFGIATELGGETAIIITFAALGGLVALAEILHTVERSPRA